jgi:hypothetical protein
VFGLLYLQPLDPRYNRAHKLFGDPVLSSQRLVEYAIEMISPQIPIGGRINEVSRDAYCVR